MARVLVVDDEQSSVKMLSMAITLLGHEPLSASCGDEAIKQVVAERPDLILLDYMMPGMNGLSTIQGIRLLPVGSQTPVILLTAAQDFYLADQVQNLDDVRYLTKPIDLNTLEAVIEESAAR